MAYLELIRNRRGDVPTLRRQWSAIYKDMDRYTTAYNSSIMKTKILEEFFLPGDARSVVVQPKPAAKDKGHQRTNKKNFYYRKSNNNNNNKENIDNEPSSSQRRQYTIADFLPLESCPPKQARHGKKSSGAAAQPKRKKNHKKTIASTAAPKTAVDNSTFVLMESLLIMAMQFKFNPYDDQSDEETDDQSN